MVKKIFTAVVLAAVLIAGCVFGYKFYKNLYGVSWTERLGNFSLLTYNNSDKAITDSAGKVISDRFDRLVVGCNSLSYVIFKGDKRGFISSQSGETIFKPEFDYAWIDNSKSGLAAVVKNKKLGFVDVRTGEVAIEPQFDFEEWYADSYDFVFRDEGVCIVPGKANKFGVIDTAGTVILPIQYDEIDFLKHGYVRVGQNHKFALYNSDFNNILPMEYDYLAVSDQGIAVCQKDYENGHKQYLLAFNGKDVINNLLLDFAEFEELVMPLYEPTPDKWDDYGNRIYGARSPYSKYQIVDRYGIFDNRYNIVIPPKYNDIDYLGNGYFGCLLGSEGVIVDSKGKFVHTK